MAKEYKPTEERRKLGKNMFCRGRDLRNEADVEQFFLIRLLKDLGYKDKDIHAKETIKERIMGKGLKRKKYRPDYLLYINKDPVIAIDVKHPEKNADEGLGDALTYARVLNGDYIGKNPIQYCIGSNGITTKVCRWDENKAFLTLNFSDFNTGKLKYKQLADTISYNILKAQIKKVEKTTLVRNFEFRKPEIAELKGIFTACHNLVWRKQRIKPSEAFYEFSKILFVKLNEDKKIHTKLEHNEKVTPEDFVFSVDWIDKQKIDKNPINNQLFVDSRDNLEGEIARKRKKRIFKHNEEININPPIIREVVKLLKHLNLYAVEEDLSGRIFETFLGATIRGKELGQFFTPRTVVEFMVGLADLKVKPREHIDIVLDACCGTGGFLIYAMTDMIKKVRDNKSLSNLEQKKIIDKIKGGHLYGIDDNDEIARVSRMNMYIHGDGGSYIYKLDALDKEFNKIEDEKDREIREYAEEFRDKIQRGLRFDVVLTNPPFAMKYEKQDPKDKEVLVEYDCAYSDLNESGEKDSKKLKASIKSNIMFLERYYDLLKPHGKLLTIIDESVLNTEGQGGSMRKFRRWLRAHYIIKAVLSLPKNTFVNADVNPKTSIFYLMKKEKPNEEQPDVFMAISENVGHNDAGKPTPDKNDLPSILEKYKGFEHGEY